MTQMYLKIENEGTCPYKAFTTLGCGLSDTFKDPAMSDLIVGKFHSGAKYSIALLLREKLVPVVFLSNLRMDFLVEESTIEDELASKQVKEIFIKYSGKDETGKSKSTKESLQFTTEFGEVNWQEVTMAVREFVSNAIDFSIRKFGNWNNVVVDLVTEHQVSAKAGTTRVFIPVNSEVFKFYENLGKWFLHFSEPEMLRTGILPKKNRSMSGSGKAVVYRRGVFVRECEGEESLYDYNLNNLDIDECRQANDYTVRYYANKALGNCKDKNIINNYLQTLGEKRWEYETCEYTLTDAVENNAETWKECYQTVYGERVVCTQFSFERVARKGFEPLIVDDKVFKVLASARIRTYLDVLSAEENRGIDIVEANPEMQKTLDGIWSFLERNHLSGGKEKPVIRSFVSVTSESANYRGFHNDACIFVRNTLGGGELFKTIISQLSEFIPGAAPLSNDSQAFLEDIVYALHVEMNS